MATQRLAPLSEMQATDEAASADCSPSAKPDLSGDINEEVCLRDTQDDQQQDAEQDAPIKCSAVHTLERDMPTSDYSHLVSELRARILHDHETSPGLYSQVDVDKCRDDDWHLSRYLIRQKLDLDQAHTMLKRAMRFRNESLNNSLRPEDFPEEFYRLGGLFGYEADRKGNLMLYLRVRVHRKVPELQAVLQAFLYQQISQLDERAKGRGMPHRCYCYCSCCYRCCYCFLLLPRSTVANTSYVHVYARARPGISIVLDCTGGGLINADMEMLMFLISTLVNYFPKGLSYILVHELPWILKPFWYMAKAWVSDEHKQLIKFSNAQSIYEYVDKENLPDFMGGTCARDYTAAPANCTQLAQAAKMWGVRPDLCKRVLQRFHGLLADDVWQRAYAAINEQERAYNANNKLQPEQQEQEMLERTSNASDQENKTPDDRSLD